MEPEKKESLLEAKESGQQEQKEHPSQEGSIVAKVILAIIMIYFISQVISYSGRRSFVFSFGPSARPSPGSEYMDEGNYEAALEYYMGELETVKKNYQEYQPSTAVIYHNIATAYYYMDDYEPAVEYLKKAAERYKMSRDTENLAWTYYNIGYVLHDAQNYEESIQYMNDAVAKIKKATGKESPDTGDFLTQLGITYKSAKQYGQASVRQTCI